MPAIIGVSDGLSIGKSYVASPHTHRVRNASTRSFWERLQEAMRDKGMKPTQTGAGRLIGLSQPAVNDWTLGKHPTMDNAIALATKLDVTVEWLLTERGPKRPLPQDALAQELWEIWPQLNEATKGKLIGIASGTLYPSEADTPKKRQHA